MDANADDELIRLLKERAPLREPNALDAAAYVGMKIAEYGCYSILGITLFLAAIATGWLG